MIRIATIDDLNSVMIVINDAKELFRKDGSDQWQDLDNYPNEKTLLEDINKNQLYVKLKNNEIVGCVVLSKELEECYNNIYDGHWEVEDDYMVIHRIAVRKDSYRMGIGYELINEMINIAKYNQVKAIKIDTKSENLRMKALLNKVGFKEVGKVQLLRNDCLDKERVVFEFVL